MAIDDDDAIDWVSALAKFKDHKSAYVEITPESISIINLMDSFDQIERSAAVPNRLALAAKSMHLALQAALTAVLAGTANIGAHPEKIRLQYLAYLNDRENPKAVRPTSDRVMGFEDLLDKACSTSLEWSGEPLNLSEPDRALIDRLTSVRHDVEHPKQALHAIEPAYIKETLPLAAALTLQLLDQVSHHFEDGELEEAKLLSKQVFKQLGE